MRLPVMLDPRRILPDQITGDIADRPDDGFGLPFQARFADAEDAFVGAHLDEDQIGPPREEHVRNHLGDFQIQLAASTGRVHGLAHLRHPYQSATLPSSCQNAGGRPDTCGNFAAASRSSSIPSPGPSGIAK